MIYLYEYKNLVLNISIIYNISYNWIQNSTKEKYTGHILCGPQIIMVHINESWSIKKIICAKHKSIELHYLGSKPK